tara:strand:+ start:593 stop:1942 length:1350 start_codon:yes stop_codon:yes gene_type:complete
MSSENKVLTRFAPSPTGNLHIGNARSAILNWIYAEKFNGNFILRIDDTDKERSKEEFIDSIKEDLKWLGVKWGLTFKQSERIENYNNKILELKKLKRIYPCFETPQELSLKRKTLISQGKPPIYDRSSLKLTEAQKEEYIAKGKKPYWRFLINNEKIYWEDLIRGDVNFDPKNLSDPILIREDGSLLYHLPSVVDDITENITVIIRGEDHVNNTAFHIQLFEALNAKSPIFGHHPLLMDEKGKVLGKRLGGLSLKDIKNEGFENLTLINYLLTIGTSNNLSSDVEFSSIIKSFDIKNLARSSPKLNKNDLIKINSDILKKLNFETVKVKLDNMGISNSTPEFWNLIKNNILFISESVEWWNIISSQNVLYEEDKEFLKECATVLPKEPFNLKTWDEWLLNIKKISTRQGKELFKPIRLALTGKETGPELKFLLPLLSRELILNRLGIKK